MYSIVGSKSSGFTWWIFILKSSNVTLPIRYLLTVVVSNGLLIYLNCRIFKICNTLSANNLTLSLEFVRIPRITDNACWWSVISANIFLGIPSDRLRTKFLPTPLSHVYIPFKSISHCALTCYIWKLGDLVS